MSSRLIQHSLLFVCPDCKKKLIKKNAHLNCNDCTKSYALLDDIPSFLPRKLSEVKMIDAQTYTIRAGSFKETEALAMKRPSFCDPLRSFPKKTSLFLELCGGAAHHALNLMKDGYMVVESDIAFGAVQKAKQFALRLGVQKNGFFCLIDAEHLPFADNYFEGIFLISSLHHLPEPRKALLEIYRCLKPNGILLIGYEPNTWHYYLFYPFFRLFRFLIRKKSAHAVSKADDVTFGFSKRKLYGLVSEAGLEVLEIRAVDLSKKFYEQFIELSNRMFGTKLTPNNRIQRALQNFDQTLFKIPVVKNFALNWDVVARKRD